MDQIFANRWPAERDQLDLDGCGRQGFHTLSRTCGSALANIRLCRNERVVRVHIYESADICARCRINRHQRLSVALSIV